MQVASNEKGIDDKLKNTPFTNDILYVADYQSKRGVTYGSAETGEVMGFIQGSEPEGVVVDADGNVYTGEVTGGEGGDGMIMRKFIKQ